MTPHRNQDTHDLAAIPHLNETEIHYLWHSVWFDGPLNGMVEYRGKRAWFDYHSDTEDDQHLRYVLYPMTQEQVATAEIWRSTRGRWDAATKQWIDRDLERHDESWLGPDFAEVNPLGWFIDGMNREFYGVRPIRPGEP